jgi:hypothetical protein
MPLVGFEPTISAGEQPKTYALDRAAIGTGYLADIYMYILAPSPDLHPSSGSKLLQRDKIVRKVRVGCHWKYG